MHDRADVLRDPSHLALGVGTGAQRADDGRAVERAHLEVQGDGGRVGTAADAPVDDRDVRVDDPAPERGAEIGTRRPEGGAPLARPLGRERNRGARKPQCDAEADPDDQTKRMPHVVVRRIEALPT